MFPHSIMMQITILEEIIFPIPSRRNTSGGGGPYNVNLVETQSRQSRDSPIGCSYSTVDEIDINAGRNAEPVGTPSSAAVGKQTHRKSVFKKQRGTSSPAMVNYYIF